MGLMNSVARWAGNVAASYEEAKWQRLSLKDPAGWRAFSGRESNAGELVTLDTAMQLSTVWACIRLTAQAIASLPIVIYSVDRNGVKVPDTESRLGIILRQSPNEYQTGFEFWETLIAWCAASGNGYAEIVRIGGQVVALQPYPTPAVSRTRRDGRALFIVRDSGGEQREVLPENMLHLKWFDMGAGMGLSPIRYGANSMGLAMATDKAAGKVFANGIRPTGFFMFPNVLKPEQRQQAQETLVKPLQGADSAGAIGILEAGVKFEAVSLNPEDAEMLASRRFNIEEMARWFGVPPIIIGHAAEGQTMWGSGVEQILLAWLALGINPLCRRIEARIRKQLTAGTPLDVEFNREGLLQMDSGAKASFLSSMVQNGLMDRNEGRMKLNMPPREGAGALTAQTNLAPLDQLGGAASADQAARSAVRAWLGLDEGKRDVET